jgi:hypothetical protein
MGRRKHGFWVCREAGRIPPEPLIIPETGKALWDGRFLVTAAPGASVRPPDRTSLPLGEGVPVFARRAYPVVEQPAGTATDPVVAFQRITPP